MIKMVLAKSTSSGAEWELRKEFYEQYKEDFSIIKEYQVEDEAERQANLDTPKEVQHEPKAPTKKGK